MDFEPGQTQFHGGFFYIQRIHRILLALDEITARRTDVAGDMAGLLRLNYNILNALFKELSPKMDEKLRTKHIEAADILKKELEENIKKYSKEKTMSMELEKKFDGWERELKIFAEKKGLLVPDKMSPGDALGW